MADGVGSLELHVGVHARDIVRVHAHLGRRRLGGLHRLAEVAAHDAVLADEEGLVLVGPVLHGDALGWLVALALACDGARLAEPHRALAPPTSHGGTDEGLLVSAQPRRPVLELVHPRPLPRLARLPLALVAAHGLGVGRHAHAEDGLGERG